MAKRVCLRAYGNQFVRVLGPSGGLFVPPDAGPDPWEIFTRTELGSGRVTLEPARSTPDARLFLSAEDGGGGLVLARRAPAGDWETFTEVTMPGDRVRLRAHDGRYLCAAGGGGDLLLADRGVPGGWETFARLDLDGGRIALQAANGCYLRAESGGGGRVVVNRDNREHETVELDSATHAPHVTVRAANGRFWRAEGGGYGSGPVRASREVVEGDWEKFGLTNNADGTIALQAKQGRKYVQAEEGGGARVLANGDGIGIWEKFVRTPWFDRPRPRKLLVYHGYPSLINGAGGDVAAAGQAFSRYEYVILGRGLEDPAHSDHARTAEIIARVRWNTGGLTRVFGCVALGPAPLGPGSARLTANEVVAHAEQWRAMGARGILLGEFGFDFQSGSPAEKRSRQNDIVARVHALGLPVAVNAANPADAFDPAAGPVALTARDFYLAEGHAVQSGDYQPGTQWHAHAEQVRAYQSTVDFRVLSTTTAGTAAFDRDMFSYAWHAALLYGHEATGWGEREFGAHGTGAHAAPFHERPNLCPGYFTGQLTVSGTAYQRATDAGIVYIDPTTHTAGLR